MSVSSSEGEDELVLSRATRYRRQREKRARVEEAGENAAGVLQVPVAAQVPIAEDLGRVGEQALLHIPEPENVDQDHAEREQLQGVDAGQLEEESDSDSDLESVHMQHHEDVEDELNPEADPDDPDDPHHPESSVGEVTDSDEDSDEDEETQPFSFDDARLNKAVVMVAQPTVREVLLLDLALMIRHKLTYEALITGFVNKNILFGRKYFPTSKKELWSILGRQNSGIQHHVYCSLCGSYIGKKKQLGEYVQCHGNNCNFGIEKKNAKYFVTISLRRQLEHFLKIPVMGELLKYKDTRRKFSGGIEDCFDGEYYKTLVEENVVGPNDLTGVLNVDGCKIRKGAKLDIYPAFFRLDNLPPQLRQKFIFLAAVYVDKVDPHMTCLFKPVVAELNKLGRRGVVWSRSGEEVESRVFARCFCVDGKARHQLLNMSTHQSYDGCTYCTIHGVPVGVHNTMRWPSLSDPEVAPPSDRTDEGMKRSMQEAQQSGQAVQGHKGCSALMLLNNFDLRKGNAVDDLHVIYECAAAHVTDLLLEVAPLVDVRMSRERLRNIVDARLRAIKTPSRIARKPDSCSIQNRKQFKGSQWRDWLMHYAVPCTKGLVDQEYLNPLELLSNGAFLLSQDIILEEHIEQAEECFISFLAENQRLYGLEHTKLNLHTLIHAARSVRENGNLWCYSTFNFESWNHKLIQNVMSPSGALLQIVVRHLVHVALQTSIHSQENISEAVRSQISKILQKQKLVNVFQVSEHVYLAGRPTRQECTEVERELLLEENYGNVHEMMVYEKIIIRSTSFSLPKPQSKSDDSLIYTYSDHFCKIIKIVKFETEEGSKCGLFVIKRNVGPLQFQHATHISLLIESDQDPLQFILPKDVRAPCVKVPVLGDLFVTPIPNLFEID